MIVCVRLLFAVRPKLLSLLVVRLSITFDKIPPSLQSFLSLLFRSVEPTSSNLLMTKTFVSSLAMRVNQPRDNLLRQELP